MDSYGIKDVALYLRKSRDELGLGEDVLIKHENDLADLCKVRGWRYVSYKEIGTSDSIAYRPVMLRLLDDVRQGLYDAAVVVDVDRLGRGKQGDWDIIREAFGDSGTFIVTPSKIYDLSNDDHETMFEFETFFAHIEYRMIKKRLARGKRSGAKLGKWTNGMPPYPYNYDRETKSLVIDPVKLEVYNEMKAQSLSGVPCYELAWVLNRKGIPAPRGRFWSENTVYRILTSEVHLGRLIFGKTRGSGHKNRPTKPFRKLPRDQWIIVENAHTQVKTIEEHFQILEIFESRKMIPVRSRCGTYVFSGILRCGICGFTLQFLTKKDSKVSIKRCQHANVYGNRCINRGGDLAFVHDVVFSELKKYEKELTRIDLSLQTSEHESIEQVKKSKQGALAKLRAGLEKIKELYEMGDYSKDEYIRRRDSRLEEISRKEEEIRTLEMALDNQLSVEEKVERINRFQNTWALADIDAKEKNRLLKQIIDTIFYKRLGDDIEVEVKFL